MNDDDLLALVFRAGAIPRDDAVRWDAALEIELQLISVLLDLGQNRRGAAARELFGTVPHARGLRLGERRTIASVSLNVTERSLVRSWESDIVLDVAAELYRRFVLDSSLHRPEIEPE